MQNKDISVADMAAFCKKKGFVYPSGEIYGGLSGFFDFGPIGLMLKRNIKELYWDEFVRKRQDVVGLDGSIITAPRTWKASGHLDNFFDHVIMCKKCKHQVKAEEFIEEKANIDADGLSEDEITSVIKEKELRCPKCKGEIVVEKPLNLMFYTEVGTGKESIKSYLRPETAQSIFVNFKNIFDSQRLKLPFGIAQMGKAFRNEISPRNFLFRTREFEQIELEYFVHPDKVDEVPNFDKIKKEKVNFLSREEQLKEKSKMTKISFEDISKKSNRWQAYWLYLSYKWFVDYGISKESIRIREHLEDELAHYANACFDVDYRFPFGWKEILGNANRGQYDLKQHMKESKTNFEVFDEVSKTKVIPYVASEPSFGVERAFLAFLFEAFEFDEERGNNVLHFNPKIAPYKFGVFPLIKKPELIKIAQDIFERLNEKFATFYDESGTIGRRYARQDENGTPFCITVDFDSLKDNSVTIRDRDTKKQVRIEIKDIEDTARELLEGKRKI